MNPFATKFDITSPISEIASKHPAKLKEGATSVFRTIEEIIPTPTTETSIAGRVLLHRSFGKICFATISDGTGKMQILFARENCSINVDGKSISTLGEDLSAYKFAEKLIDLGDFIGVK